MKAWIWTHPKPEEGPEDWKRQFAQFRAAGVDTVLACLFTGRHALFESQHVPVAAPILEQMLPIAAEEGLELHAWIVALRCNVTSIQQAHPEWFSVNRNGESCLEKPPYVGYYHWLCPSRPEAGDFVRTIVTELAVYTELKGVHLDYIRHPDVVLPQALQPKYDLVQDREFSEFDFCYCPVCRETFQQQEGIDPLEMEDPSASSAWKHFRYEGIRRIVAGAVEPAHAAGKVLSAAVFATPELARTYVRQDWPRWDLDAVFPMIYHSYYAKPTAWIEQATKEGVEALGGRCPLYSGLFIPALSPEELPQAVDHALKGGAAGISLFSHGAMTEAHWSALSRVLSSNR